jgi:hypothetical protein
MLETAWKYIHLGALITDMRVHYALIEDKDDAPKVKHEQRFKEDLKRVYNVCKDLDMGVSKALLESRLDDSPKTEGEFDVILEVLAKEAADKKFLFIPSHRSKYYDLTIQSTITVAFPMASKELVSSGDCLAAGFYTASVFHAMRAAEIGVRVLANKMEVTFPDKPIELAEWQNILDQCDSKIVALKSMKRGAEKDEALNFYSQAAVQFRYFKDSWRVRVTHARETFEENKAIKIFDHTLDFFDVLATRLKEPKPSV